MDKRSLKPTASRAYSPNHSARTAALLRRTMQLAATRTHGAGRRARNREFVCQLELLLRESPDLHITLGVLASALHLERTYCSKAFRDLVGESFSCWIRRVRISCAIQMLQSGLYSVTDVAHPLATQTSPLLRETSV